MPRDCTICGHAEREQIDREIIAGLPYRDISGRFALSKSAVERHANGHIAAAIARAAGASIAITADLLVSEVRTLREVTLGILEEARVVGDHAASLNAIARLEKQAELCGRLAGELVERHAVEQRSILIDSEWMRLRSLVVAALLPYPEAGRAVLAALRIEAGDVGS
jgi:hypothetical protein